MAIVLEEKIDKGCTRSPVKVKLRKLEELSLKLFRFIRCTAFQKSVMWSFYKKHWIIYKNNINILRLFSIDIYMCCLAQLILVIVNVLQDRYQFMVTRYEVLDHWITVSGKLDMKPHFSLLFDSFLKVPSNGMNYTSAMTCTSQNGQFRHFTVNVQLSTYVWSLKQKYKREKSTVCQLFTSFSVFFHGWHFLLLMLRKAPDQRNKQINIRYPQ